MRSQFEIVKWTEICGFLEQLGFDENHITKYSFRKQWFLSRIFSDIKIEYIYIYIGNVLHLSHNDLKEIGKFTQHLLPAQNLQKKAKKASLSYFETTTLFKQAADGSETLTRFLRVKKTVQSRTRLRPDSTHLTER